MQEPNTGTPENNPALISSTISEDSQTAANSGSYFFRVFLDPAKAAASFVVGHLQGQLNRGRNAVLGVPTGGTPGSMYKELLALSSESEHTKRLLLNAKTFNLDEYEQPMPKGYEHQGYAQFMDRSIFTALGHKAHFFPDAKDPAAYDRAIRENGGLTLTILGIGNNAHIAFNEPGSSFESRTRVVELNSKTREANARFFGNDTELVPKRAVTMGLATIVESERIILIAKGAHKADAINKMFGEVTEDVPASILQRHPHLHVFIDQACFDGLNEVVKARFLQNRN